MECTIWLTGDDDDADEEEDAEEKLPSCMDYVMHFLTIFWKVLFAFVPPTGQYLTHTILSPCSQPNSLFQTTEHLLRTICL